MSGSDKVGEPRFTFVFSPKQISVLRLVINALGVGLTFTANFSTDPTQVRLAFVKFGVTNTVSVMYLSPPFKAVKLKIVPLPAAGIPIDGRVFTQE